MRAMHQQQQRCLFCVRTSPPLACAPHPAQRRKQPSNQQTAHIHALNPDREEEQGANINPSQQQQQQPPQQHQQRLERIVAGARERWQQLDTTQRFGALATTAVLLFAIPKVLTLIVLAGERVFIGSLLAAEELILALALKLGVIGGAVVAFAAIAYTAYVFVVPRGGPRK